jgi:hypothetical protein
MKGEAVMVCRFFSADLYVSTFRKTIGKWKPLKAVRSFLVLLLAVSPTLITSTGPIQEEENK